jgi:glycogen synthase
VDRERRTPVVACSGLAPSPRPLRLVLQSLDYPPDEGVSAIGLYTRTLAQGLVGRGHVVHVVCRAGRDDVSVVDGVAVHRVGPGRPSLILSMGAGRLAAFAARSLAREAAYRLRLGRRLATIVDRERIDLVEACDSGAEAVAYDPRPYPRVPFVVRLHTPTAVWELFDRTVPEAARRWILAVERRLLSRATHLSAPSPGAADLFRREMRLGERTIEVHPNPPTLDASSIAVRRPTDGRTVLYVGRLALGKGVLTLAAAIPLVRSVHPEARFVFVGPDVPTGTAHASMGERLRASLSAADRPAVEFTGYLSREALRERFDGAAVCVVPSLFEAFGYACLEAMTFGKAIVASGVGGMVELLDGGRCGLTFEPGDAHALSERIVRLLRDGDLRDRLGDSARARAERVFGREAVMALAEDAYRRAIADLRSAPPGRHDGAPR